MIELARLRGIYHELIVADLESVLAQESRSYDLIIAADTLVYLGDLTSAFAGALRRLNAGGWFLFTVERADGAGYELGPKRRYRHNEQYVRHEAGRAGFQVMGVVQCTPRLEAHEPVNGLAVALQRP
jgi:predicted TPR repeat methyltransferase